MLDKEKNLELISAYYKLTTINYMEDILDELGISSKWRIEKPGMNKELYHPFLKEIGMVYVKKSFRADKLKTKRYSKKYG